MRLKSWVLAIAVVGLLLGAAAPAYAYPRKAVLTQAGWNCWGGRNDTYFVMSFSMDNDYARSHPFGDNGKYRYIRDTGRIRFRTGPMRDFYAKLSQGMGGWDMAIKREGSGNRWGSCMNYTVGY